MTTQQILTPSLRVLLTIAISLWILAGVGALICLFVPIDPPSYRVPALVVPSN